MAEMTHPIDVDLPDVFFGHRKSLYAECGADFTCMCRKTVLNTAEPEESVISVTPEPVDSNISLDERLRAKEDPLSKTEWRLNKKVPIKLFKNKVDRQWHKRYNYVLPEDQQFDLQPYDEIQYRDEEIALEYFYGDFIPYWLLDGSKDSQDSRSRILQRYNKERRQAEEAATERMPAVIHTRVESIISVNRTRAAETSVFGPSAAEKGKTGPIVTFMEKLVRRRLRDKERQLMKTPKRSRWHFMRHPSTLEALLRIVEAERRIRAGQKFRRTIKVVRAVVRFIRVISIMSRDARHVLTEIHYFQEHQRLQTQMKINNKTNEGGVVVGSRDVFDPNKFRFSSRFKISPDIRMILTKPWNLRSDEEVSKVVDRLQELRCFVEYPVSFQHKLARLAWLIEVAADLAIIREGHIAADFYFMLAGKAKMITLHGSPCLTERAYFHTLRTIKNGDAFGDESMSHPDSERTYSVITTEKSILMSLSSVDYISMLLTTSDNEQAPEHIIFLSTLSFLNDFPKNKLIEEGDEYIRNYYLRSGSVISENLGESEYIYVVKYGSCRVLVEMPPERAPLSSRRSTYESGETRRASMYVKGSVDSLETRKQQKRKIGRASSVTEFLHNHRDDIASNPVAVTAMKNMRQLQNDREFQADKIESDVLMSKSKRMFRSLRPATIASSEDVALRSHSKMSTSFKEPKSISEESNEDASTVGSRRNDSTETFSFYDNRSSTQSVDVRQSHSSRVNVEKHLSFIVSPTPTSRTSVKEGRSQSKHAVGTNIDIDFDLSESKTSSQVDPAKDRQSFSPLLEDGERDSLTAGELCIKGDFSGKSKLPKIPTREDIRRKSSVAVKEKMYSRWKLLKTMVKGDFIGHEWVNLNRGPYDPPQEEMSLVSDGCEVIMMHREFLIKYLRKEL